MDELIELTKKQLRFQKIISLCLAVVIVLMLVAGVMAAGYVSRMTQTLESAVEKLQEIDVDGINDAISGTQEMMESVDEFSAAVDGVTEKVHDLGDWVGGLFGR